MPTRENQYACHDLSVWNIFNKRPKFTFAQSKRFLPKHNLPDRENNSLEQAAFWHEVKVVCFLPIPLFYTGDYHCWPFHRTWRTLCMNKHLINKAVGRTQKTSFPLSSNSKASLCSDFETNPSSWASKSIQAINICHFKARALGVYSSRAVRNIANDLLKTLLDSLLTACIEI